MIALSHYDGREQSYVKHVFLERYLEALVHKTASTYSHIVYVDGFAGPWQSSAQRFEDTSFGIALRALRRAKESWKAKRAVSMAAHLVERDLVAYERLSRISEKYPEVTVRTYPGDFMHVLPRILGEIPSDAFTFFFVDPKGWRIRLNALQSMLSRRNSEVVFNFMFDFINRAASIKDPSIVTGLNELIPYGDWRKALEAAEVVANRPLTSDERKSILIDAFRESLAKLGNYDYVAETTVLRPLSDRPLYCLFYASRHRKGIEVFRDCQIKAEHEQSKVRAAVKVKHAAANTGQRELFESFHDMAPDELEVFLQHESNEAEKTLFELVPQVPGSILYENLWPQVLARHVVRRPDINKIAARLRREGRLFFPDWEQGKHIPQPYYRTQRPTVSS